MKGVIAMTLQWLLSWSNLIFVVPFVLALLYLGLYTLSGITFGDADADVGADLDGDADLGGDVHLDHDIGGDFHADAEAHVDAPGHVDADADHDADTPAGHGPAIAALQWLGVGRVPVSIVLMVLLLSWGWIGFVTNVILQSRISRASAQVAISLPLAFLGSILFTRLVSGLVARWLPTCETTARRRHELLGSVGEAIFAINEKFGLSSIRDAQGELYQVPCRVDAGQPALAKGERVKLVAYNAKEGIFRVIRWESAAAKSEIQMSKPQ